MSNVMNKRMIMVAGKSGTGKTASLRNLPNQHRWAYLNAEVGKDASFRNQLKQAVITEPGQVPATIANININAELNAQFDGIILDTLTEWMARYEETVIPKAKNGMQAWAEYKTLFKNMMQDHVATSDKSFIFLAHTADNLNPNTGLIESVVPVKGSLKDIGIEAYFSTIVHAKKISIEELRNFENPLLNITEDDEMLGFKHVFQTRTTKTTLNDRIRSPIDMWSRNETYIDNDVVLVLNRLNEYYGA